MDFHTFRFDVYSLLMIYSLLLIRPSYLTQISNLLPPLNLSSLSGNCVSLSFPFGRSSCLVSYKTLYSLQTGMVPSRPSSPFY